MVSWWWVVLALFAGLVAGMFLLAFAEVSRQEEEEARKKKGEWK